MTTETISIRIDSELWKKAKIHCAQKSLTLSAFVEALLKEELKGEKKA